MTQKEYEYEYGHTKLDHVLSHLCNGFEKLLVWVVLALTVFIATHWVTEAIAAVIYNDFMK